MNRIYGCLTGVLILSAALSPVYAKDLVAHSGTSESIKEKCISSEQTNNEIEADLQRHLERMKSEDIAKGYLREEKTYAQEVSLVRGRLYHSTDKLIHDERKTTLLSYPVGGKVPCKKSFKDIDSYTDTITRKGITFRVPKGAELKVFYVDENKIALQYKLEDIEYTIEMMPLDVDHPDSKDIENKVLVDNNNPEFKAKKHRLFPDERIIRIYEY